MCRHPPIASSSASSGVGPLVGEHRDGPELPGREMGGGAALHSAGHRVLLTTNLPGVLDRALLRPELFDRI
jgi:SpoVK/Ycf46/Vps4 family AAA+-type ATPase